MSAWIIAALATALALTCVVIRMRGRRGAKKTDDPGYKHLFDQAFDGAVVLDVANGRIHLANQRAADLLGHPLERLSQLSIFDLHSRADLQRSALRIADAWASGGLVYDDIPFKTATGEELPVECSVKVTAHVGKPAVVLYMRDIRERLRLQQEVADRNALVEQQNNEMLSSLRYARGIQQAMLPPLSQLRDAFGDAFILYKPRDIVSGDFYWCARAGEKSILVVADCTGHGVPGALLSMTGITLLQGIVNGRGILHPAEILRELDVELMRALVHQSDDAKVRDGMDIGIVLYDRITRECEFSGALANLWIQRAHTGALEEVKGDRIPLGGGNDNVPEFTTKLMQLHPGDRLLLGTDGFADQFGGPEGRKLKPAGLRSMLAAEDAGKMCHQGRALEAAFTAWKGELDQVDDVTLIGVRVG